MCKFPKRGLKIENGVPEEEAWLAYQFPRKKLSEHETVGDVTNRKN